MPDLWYYDATDSNRHTADKTYYAAEDHPDLEDVALVRETRYPPEDAEKVTGNDIAPDTHFEAFSDQHWRTRVSQIESGDVDRHLAEIIEKTQSETVKDAARARQTKRDAELA